MKHGTSALLTVALPLVWAITGCTSLNAPQRSLPGEHVLIRDALVVHSDFAVPKNHRLLEDLTALRARVAAKLELPESDEPVDVYLFDRPERLNDFLAQHHPEFPARRAIFVETDTRLVVYAQWGDRVAEDLRHEVTHGYVHAVLPRIPLWLDEGLAEYFEVPRGQNGLNEPHRQALAALRASSGWRPDLARLERLASAADMTQRDYAEAWAWTHWLLESSDERLAQLRHYLVTLRREGTAPPLSNVLARSPAELEGEFSTYVAHLAPIQERN